MTRNEIYVIVRLWKLNKRKEFRQNRIAGQLPEAEYMQKQKMLPFCPFIQANLSFRLGEGYFTQYFSHGIEYAGMVLVAACMGIKIYHTVLFGGNWMKRSRYSSGFSSYGKDRRDNNMEVYERMREDLEAYNEQGITLRLSGKRASSARIANVCCIRECGSYMGDYVLDESGRLVEICFDRVKKC